MQPGSSKRRFGWLAGVTIAYVVAGKLGLSLDPVSGFATLVWAPTGIALAALVRGGLGLWPAITVGAFLTNVWIGAAWPTAIGIAIGNTLEALLGASMLVRAGGRDAPIARIPVAFGLMAAALCSTLASATVGVASLRAAGIVDGSRMGRTWLAWWLGDALGDLVVAALLLNWTARPQLAQKHSRIEAALLALTTAGTAVLAFSGHSGVPLHQPYLIFLPLIWSATRFGSRVATLCVAVSSAVAIGFAIQGTGPFVTGSLSASLFELQAFTGFVAAATLFLAAASDERLSSIVEAQRALRTRDEFMAIASHELKTPLAALSLLVSGMQRANDRSPLIGTTPSPGADRVERARTQVARLTRLVDELLDVSRLTAGHLHLTLEPFDLSEAVRDLVTRTREQADRVGCALSVSAEAPVVGTWDRLRIEQVLSNLLSNALKYGPGKPVDVSVEANGTVAFVRVRDRGMGIGAEDVPRIFDRFERASRSTHQKGLGLGLYIARQVVKAHGGAIGVQSACGQGSTFTIELPVAPCASDSA